MTRDEYEGFVRRQYEALANESTDAAAAAVMQALGRPVFRWQTLGPAELSQLHGMIRAIRMLGEEQR